METNETTPNYVCKTKIYNKNDGIVIFRPVTI